MLLYIQFYHRSEEAVTQNGKTRQRQLVADMNKHLSWTSEPALGQPPQHEAICCHALGLLCANVVSTATCISRLMSIIAVFVNICVHHQVHLGCIYEAAFVKFPRAAGSMLLAGLGLQVEIPTHPN